MNTLIAERGMMTSSIKEMSVEKLGYEITQEELRLMPYVMHCLYNNGWYELSKLHEDEMNILEAWADRGFIQTSDEPPKFTSINKSFFDAMNELLYLGYVLPSFH